MEAARVEPDIYLEEENKYSAMTAEG